MTCLRVFISSKMGELDDERAIVKRALLARDCEPILFDDMGARPTSAQTTYLAGVRAADVYVGIFWNAYSAATEEEYRLARELGKPCFVYIKESARRDAELERLLAEISDPQRGVKYFPFRTVIELETQVQKDIQAWLTERALNPQEFTSQQLQDALRNYLQWLIDTNTYVFPRGIMQTARNVSLKLDDVFVSLRAEREVLTADRRRQTADVSEFMSGGQQSVVGGRGEDAWLVEQWTRREFERTRIERVSLAQAIREHARVIFLGEPGAGKTTLLRYLALLFARGCRDSELRVRSGEFTTPNSPLATPNSPLATPDSPLATPNSLHIHDHDGNDYGTARLPIFVRIADYADAFARQRTLSLREFLPDAFCDVPAPRDALARIFDDALARGHALVLLDGLDEIVDAGDRASIATQIERFVAAYARQGNRFVVTSRIAGYRSAPLGGEFVHFTLAPMDESEIEKFLARWCPAVERAQTPDAPEAEIARRAKIEQDGILDAVRKHIGVRRLTENPLLLTILALIHRTGARLPSRRIELYQLATKTLLEDWELARGIPSEHVVKEGEALRLLGPLALWLHENKPTGVASEDEVRVQLAQTLAAQRHAAPDDAAIQDAVDDFLRRVREHTGILTERAPRRYGFLHLTFEEYFCARELVRQPTQAAARIRAHLHDPRWNEPILLGIAYLSDAFPDFASEVIRTAILDAHSPYEEILCRDLLLALQAMGDCASVDAQLCNNAVQQAVAIYLGRDPRGRFEPLRDRILDVLSNARGSPVTQQAVPLLIAALRDEDANVRERAAYALGEIGDVRAVEPLLVALRDENADVRGRAADALGRIGDVRAVEPLLVALRDESRLVRASAADALGKIGDVRAVEALLVALRDEDTSVHTSAVGALGEIGDVQAVEPLLVALRDEDAMVRLRAADALVKIGDARAVEALLVALRDEDAMVRLRAADALGKIGDVQAVEPLLVVLQD
ncbi:MAG: HEAT repeat domain-containing protein, partial [Anaerolineae bacterium]|nr:HEAT repeat domain-containing protein [Anaerolineae bacterium]